MKRCKVAICDEEVDYAFRLMNYINNQPDNPCMAMAFTNQDNLIQYMDNNSIELLIAGDNIDLQTPETVPTLWLTDGDDIIHQGSLYKYQPADEIVSVVMEHISYQSAPYVKSQSKQQVVAIYSPIGRCGKTNLALALCHHRGNQSLYVGFEEYSSLADGSQPTEELLYYIKQQDKNILNRLHHLTSLDGHCRMIQSPSCYLDIRQIASTDLEWFIGQLNNESYYQTVVFDLGVGSIADYNIFSLFDTIYFPILSNAVSQIKINHFYEFLNKSNLLHLKERIHEIQLPDEDYNSVSMKELVSALLTGGNP